MCIRKKMIMKKIIILVIALGMFVALGIFTYNKSIELKTLSDDIIPRLYEEFDCQHNGSNTSCIRYGGIIYVMNGNIQLKGIFSSYRSLYGDMLGYIINNDNVRIYESTLSKDDEIIKYTIDSKLKDGISYKKVDNVG